MGSTSIFRNQSRCNFAGDQYQGSSCYCGRGKFFFNRYNRVVKTLKAAKSIIWYHSLDKLSKNSSVEITRSLTLVGFSDAGFGSLSDGRSTKSCVVILSSAVKTVEEISCSGWLVYSSAGKMSRVARSSLAAEVVALSECVDFL